MLISQAFRPMIELEKQMSALYESWSDRFSSDREAAVLFAKMSREEKAHASLIEYQQRIFQKNRQFETQVTIETEAIEETVEAIRKLRAGKPPASVAQAITIALGLEASAGDARYRNTLRQANEEVEKLLNNLSKEDGAHQAALREFAAKRGIDVPS